MQKVISSAGEGQTISPTVIATPTSVVTRPEWIRLPPSGSRDPWTGMCRSGINELVLPCKTNDFNPPVKSSVLRKKGSLKGVRLIYLQSLLDYIENHVEKGI